MGRKKKIKVVDAWDVNQISISKVAQDWDIELISKGHGVFIMKCPSPIHPGEDKHIGNCVLTDNGKINCYHCFVCGTGGGPINLVMDLEGCNMITAKNILSKKYGICKEQYVDESLLPPNWNGLSTEEYNELGLYNTSGEFPYAIDDNENVLCKYERYTLRDLARDEPELHDTMLIGKFAEKIENLAKFLALLKNDYFLEYGLDLIYNDSWVDACIQIGEHYKDLLKKGVMEKDRYYEVVKEESIITQKVDAKVLEILKESYKKSHPTNLSTVSASSCKVNKIAK